MSLLDVGCGPGTLTADLARRVAPAWVVGLDSASEVVAEASKEAKGSGNVEFILGDVNSIAFPDDSFDVATRSSSI